MNRSLVVLALAASAVLSSIAHAQRIVPTSNPILYVAPPSSCMPGTWGGGAAPAVTACGNDSPSCGSMAVPCATPQYAADILYADYDFQCKYFPTIQLDVAPAGSAFFYPGLNISGRMVGQCGTLHPLVNSMTMAPLAMGKYLPFTMQGDTTRSILSTSTDPMGAFIFPGNMGFPISAGISLTDGAALRVFGLGIDTTNAFTDCIDLMTNSFMELSQVVFGQAGIAYRQPGFGLNNHITVSFYSNLLITKNPNGGQDYFIGGSASSHILVSGGGTVDYDNNGDPAIPFNVTLYNNVGHFPNGFVQVEGGTLLAQDIQWTLQPGAVIYGPPAIVYGNGVVFTGTGTGNYTGGAHSCNPTYFPGNADGTTPIIISDNSTCK